MKNLIYILFFTLFFTSFLNANQDSLEKVSIQLKWFYQYQFAGILVAKEKGFFKDAGLDVEIKERDPKKNNILQVVNGESQYGIADSVILRYRAKGYPVKVISTIFQHNAMVLISKKGSGIVSLYEMRGKSISYQEGLDDSIITSLFSFANLNKSDYIKKPMDFTHMDFVDGNVDISEAYISIEPYWLKKKHNIEVNIIDPKNYGIDFYGDLIFTTEEEIKKHPERVKAFKKATLQGWAHALKHPDEAINIILKKYNTQNLTYEQLLYEARITENLVATKYIPLGNVKKERFHILADLYTTDGVSKEKIYEAVQTIVYNPNHKSNFFEKYIFMILISGIALIILVILLALYNKRLHYLVAQRTRELENSKREAELASETKSVFLANMSHEIRTPMNAILGFVEQLQKGEYDPKRKKLFKTVQDSGHNLVTIINNILDISKIQSEQMKLNIQACNLTKLLNDVTELFTQIAKEKNITYTIKITKDFNHNVMLDDVRVKQVLINILSNAMKFTSAGGKVIVDISIDKKINMIKIEILDTGIGIEKDNISKIFNAFEQEDASTTRRFGGTGLGLAISEKLIKMMNGNISVRSDVGKGSTFSIFIPYVISENVVNTSSDNESKISINTLNTKVLVVEDNKTNQILMSMILDDLSLSYDIANNGQEAVDMFNEDSNYTIILMDENMPVMSGIEAVKKIRAIEEDKDLNTIPIIAVTANALNGAKEHFLKVGMNDYISKPYKEKDIKEIISKYSIF